MTELKSENTADNYSIKHLLTESFLIQIDCRIFLIYIEFTHNF